MYGGEEREGQKHKPVEASSYFGSPKAERKSVADPENVVASELSFEGSTEVPGPLEVRRLLVVLKFSMSYHGGHGGLAWT